MTNEPELLFTLLRPRRLGLALVALAECLKNSRRPKEKGDRDADHSRKLPTDVLAGGLTPCGPTQKVSNAIRNKYVTTIEAARAVLKPPFVSDLSRRGTP